MAEGNSYGLTTTPIPHPCCVAVPPPSAPGAGNEGLKLSPGKRKGSGEGVLVFVFISRHPIPL